MKKENHRHRVKCLTKRAPDAGDSAAISSSFYALSFFWLDDFAVPAPAQVTQTVSLLVMGKTKET